MCMQETIHSCLVPKTTGKSSWFPPERLLNGFSLVVVVVVLVLFLLSALPVMIVEVCDCCAAVQPLTVSLPLSPHSPRSRSHHVQALHAKLSLDALLQMTGAQVRDTMRRLGSSSEECARLIAALSCLRSAAESGTSTLTWHLQTHFSAPHHPDKITHLVFHFFSPVCRILKSAEFSVLPLCRLREGPPQFFCIFLINHSWNHSWSWRLLFCVFYCTVLFLMIPKSFAVHWWCLFKASYLKFPLEGLEWLLNGAVA